VVAGLLLYPFGPLQNICRGQESGLRSPGPPLSNQASKRGAGSAAALIGRVAVAQIFLDDDVSRWTAADIERTERELEMAFDFIARHAAIHGQEVQLRRAASRQARFSGAIPLDSHAPPGWTETAIRQALGHSARREVVALCKANASEQGAICLHVNRAALSYNLAFYQGVQRKFAAERAVCFRQYPDGRTTAPATYAHEILHLFGAGDLYFPYDKDATRRQSAARWFPDDIMFRVDYNLGQLLIGGFTAYRVGWLPVLESRWEHLEDRQAP
jgi:hypothetical protein